jgi:hypothetical protein
VPDDEEPVVAEEEPWLEIASDLQPSESESVGPSLGAEPEEEGASPEPEVAPLDEVPAGIPVETEGSDEE